MIRFTVTLVSLHVLPAPGINLIVILLVAEFYFYFIYIDSLLLQGSNFTFYWMQFRIHFSLLKQYRNLNEVNENSFDCISVVLHWLFFFSRLNQLQLQYIKLKCVIWKLDPYVIRKFLTSGDRCTWRDCCLKQALYDIIS